jgi:D-alanyl-D-alanine carboxypeptidase (penicillin-binding protein 5/6)
MLRRVIRFLLVGLTVVLATVVAVGSTVVPAPAQEPPPPSPTETTAPVAPPRASIVIDVETGEVITESNAREALPPASTTKILTALLVRQNLDIDGDVGVSATSTMAPPRRLALQYGSTWGVRDLLYAMMLCSCNDAAWALGQAAGGGTMPGYHDQAQALAERLGLADGPVLFDPAGLDDERSVEGGNLLSARDLAIAARAFLADPELSEIATAPSHEWTGGDGQPHSVTNLNAFLGAYPGAIGLKTGFTSRAGMTFVGAAERDGRTLVAVVLGSEAHYAHARELLDAGFMLASIDETTDDVLPPVPEGLAATTTTTTTTSTAPEAASSDADPGADPTATAGGDDVAAPPLRPTGADDDLPVEPQWIILGAGVVTLMVAMALLARWRMTRDRIDRRPATPRRRDRHR